MNLGHWISLICLIVAGWMGFSAQSLIWLVPLASANSFGFFIAHNPLIEAAEVKNSGYIIRIFLLSLFVYLAAGYGIGHLISRLVG